MTHTIPRNYVLVSKGTTRHGDRFWRVAYWLPITGTNVGKDVAEFYAVIRRVEQ
jgi:hypothetical protein